VPINRLIPPTALQVAISHVLPFYKPRPRLPEVDRALARGSDPSDDLRKLVLLEDYAWLASLVPSEQEAAVMEAKMTEAEWWERKENDFEFLEAIRRWMIWKGLTTGAMG
jgi:hypothetical protein